MTRKNFTKILLMALMLIGIGVLITIAVFTFSKSSSAPAETPQASNEEVTDPVTKTDEKSEDTFLSTEGNQIVNANGDPYIIKSISWFGFETSNCILHGLWTIPLADGLETIAEQGFNTIRIPYSNQCLAGAEVNGVDFYKNPELEGKTSLESLDYVIEQAEVHKLRVILDRHRPGYDAQSEAWFTEQYPEQKWLEDWTMLAKRYSGNKTVIGADLHNEPRGETCWACGDPARDWKIAATKAGNAIHEVNPEWLIIVEGIEKSKNGDFYWWGGNLKDFGNNLVDLEVKNKVVYSTHDYPQSVYGQKWFGDPNYPNNLEIVWHDYWGYLKDLNVPVFVGEFGSKLQTDSDKKWFTSLVNYIDENNFSFSYWSFNPNSGDTGGIVKDDWTTVESEKVKALAPLLNPSQQAKNKDKVEESTNTETPGAQYVLKDKWTQGYVVDLTINEKASREPNPWIVSWSDPAATAIVNSWGTKCTLEKPIITCTADGFGLENLQWEDSVVVGLQIESLDGTKAPENPALTVK